MKSRRVGIISEIDYKETKIKILYWIIFVLLLFACVICVAPMIWVMVSAGKDVKEFYSVPPTIIPKSLNIKSVFTVRDRWFGCYFQGLPCVKGAVSVTD